MHLSILVTPQQAASKRLGWLELFGRLERLDTEVNRRVCCDAIVTQHTKAVLLRERCERLLSQDAFAVDHDDAGQKEPVALHPRLRRRIKRLDECNMFKRYEPPANGDSGHGIPPLLLMIIKGYAHAVSSTIHALCWKQFSQGHQKRFQITTTSCAAFHSAAKKAEPICQQCRRQRLVELV
jgi:hypothetical protein